MKERNGRVEEGKQFFYEKQFIFPPKKKWVHLLYLKKRYPLYPKYPFWLGCSCCVARTGPPLGFVVCHVPSFCPRRVVRRRPALARILPSRSPKGSLGLEGAACAHGASPAVLHGHPLESHVFLLAHKTQTVLKQSGKGEGGRDVIPKDHGVCRVRAPLGSPEKAPGARARFGLISSSLNKEDRRLGSSLSCLCNAAPPMLPPGREGWKMVREGRRGAFLQDSLFFPAGHHTW